MEKNNNDNESMIINEMMILIHLKPIKINSLVLKLIKRKSKFVYVE